MRHKAIGYIRVSTEEQGKSGISIDSQHEKIKRYAEFKGFELINLEELPVSGSLPFNDRKVGHGISGFIKDGTITDLIVTKLDRLFRDLKDCVLNIEDWEGKIVVHLVDEGGIIDTSTPDGYLNVMIKALFASHELRVIRHRTKTSLQHKKATGKVYNHLPYGYDDYKGDLVPNDTEQEVIWTMKDMDEKDGASLTAISRYLNDEKIPAKRGGIWYPKTVKKVLEDNA